MCKRGDIILVPFPFTDLSSAKVRPALVLSEKKAGSLDVIVCFISSQRCSKSTHAVPIEPNASNGLKVSSIVRFDKIATLDRRIILGVLGIVSKSWLSAHKKALMSVFGL
jgi:mRNA interferase MazF